MKPLHIVGWAAIIIGGLDLLLGQSSTPLPVIGDYLTPPIDAVLLLGGAALIFNVIG
jgi:hypothetical protein